MNVSKAVLITGCSSGIGWATAGGRSGTPSDHGEGWIVGVHHHDGGDAGCDRSPREPVVGDHKVDRSRLPQYIPHGLGIVGVEQAGPVAEGSHRLRPV